jgi:hypothetical protein
MAMRLDPFDLRIPRVMARERLEAITEIEYARRDRA